MEPEIFHEFLSYLYTDAIQCPKSLLPELMKCAGNSLETLTNYDSNTISKLVLNLTPLTFFFPEKYQVLRLKKMCLDLTSKFSVDVPESTFSSDMKQAINNQLLSDITFVVQGEKFLCHKAILCQVKQRYYFLDLNILNSDSNNFLQHEYFRAMFSNHFQMKESTQREIHMDSVSPLVFNVILDYVYTFKFQSGLAPDLLVEVFQETNLFLIEGTGIISIIFLTSENQIL